MKRQAALLLSLEFHSERFGRRTQRLCRGRSRRISLDDPLRRHEQGSRGSAVPKPMDS